MNIISNKQVWILLVLVLCTLPIVVAEDTYKPYLHQAEVPEHPELSLAGEYKTDLFPGAATYTYGLDLPPGTNSLQPSVAISYNSQATRQRPGLLGAGWTMTQHVILRDINGSINDTFDDLFVLILDGSVNDLSYDARDTQYHTEIESYQRIQNLTEAGNDYWLVTARDGTKYRFGYNTSSELTSNRGFSYAVKWFLDEVEDTHGNKIFYHYEQDPYSGDIGTVYLSEISYNSGEERRVKFSYETQARPDARYVYEQGNKLNETRRLATVSIEVDNSVVRKYLFNYVNLNDQKTLSSLANITHVGNDGTSVLHTVSFDYYGSDPGFYKNTTKWVPPELFSEEYSFDYGMRLADVDNDGFIDFVKGREFNGDLKVWINDKTDSWDLDATWNLPTFFVGDNDKDEGVRVVDINRDGFVDLVRADGYQIYYKQIWLNNGTGWTNESTGWSFPNNTYFVNEYDKDDGVRIVDINGDALPDLIQNTKGSNGAINNTFLNNGTGWENTSFWTVPTPFTENIADTTYADTGARLIDFNGDGLVDIVRGSDLFDTTFRGAWRNNGSGWENVSDVWAPPVYFTTTDKRDFGVRILDVNGDGLPDLVEDFENSTGTNKSAWINTGNGWTNVSVWQSPEPFTENGNNIGRRIADVEGDGLPDILVAYGNETADFQYVQVKNDTIPYLLKNITTEFGGEISFEYQDLTIFDNTGIDDLSDLGFNLLIVQAVTQDNGLDNAFGMVSTTNYSYTHGKYDYTEREFIGFGQVNETFSDNTLVVHYFNQTEGARGREYKTETFDMNRVLYAVEERFFRAVYNQSFYNVYLDKEQNSLYDGISTNPFVTNVSYTYGPFGAVTKKAYSGGGKIEAFEYWFNTNNWIIDRIKNYTLLDGEVIMQNTLYSYDGNVNGGPNSLGELTRVESLINTTEENQITHFTYDSHGNLETQTDALGRVTSYSYGSTDPTFTFKDRETNPLGHITDFSYDLATGNMLWEEKNSIKNYFTYDEFGRIAREIQPYDSFELPTSSYTYIFDGIAPEIIEVAERVSLNETYNVSYYYDGFGNLIQIKSDAESNQQVVKDFFYDDKLRVVAESIPHFETDSADLSTASSYYTNYSYDALDRVTNVSNPDGTNKTITFTHKNVTTLDENGHKKVYRLDDYGRIIHVYEYMTDPFVGLADIYNTSYDYDVMDNVVRIEDHEGNIFSFAFDSLGRRIKMSDPDLGDWNYSYDPVNNLITQEDAKANVVTFSYDDLDRVVSKASNGEEEIYAYDGQFFGTLTNITKDNVLYTYTYDDRYRVVDETATLGLITLDVSTAYDSLDRVEVEAFEGNDGLGYSYNAQGLLSQVSGFIDSTDYSAFGTATQRNYNNAKVTNFVYENTTGRIQNISTDTIQILDYMYDDVGNIIQINDSANLRLQTMIYDDLDRLVEASINELHYLYVYDALGRMEVFVKNFGTSTRMVFNSEDPVHAPSSFETGVAGVFVHRVNVTNTGDKDKQVEFYVVNARNISLVNVSWIVDWGDNAVTSGDRINLSVDGFEKITTTHTYGTGGSYTVNVNASVALSDDGASEEELGFGIMAESLTFLDQEADNATYEFIAKNDFSITNVTNISWSCDNGMVSTIPFNLTAGEDIMIFTGSSFPTPGMKDFGCAVNSTDGNEDLRIEFEMRGVEIENYLSTPLSGSEQLVTFDLHNYFKLQTGVKWVVSSENQVHTNTIALPADGITPISQQLNFTYPGEKVIIVNVTKAPQFDNVSEVIVLSGIDIEEYLLVNKTASARVFNFTVRNNWAENVTLWWNMSDPDMNSENNTVVVFNDTVVFSIEHNYTTSGQKYPVFNVSSGTFSDSVSDTFSLALLEIVSNTELFESQSSTIIEIHARNNIQRLPMSWRLTTGESLILSDSNTFLNKTEEAFIFVETNYSAPGGYITSARVSSGMFNHTVEGEVVV